MHTRPSVSASSMRCASVLLVLALGMACIANRPQLPVEINVKGGSQSKPNPVAPPPTQPPPPIKEPPLPPPRPTVPLIAGRWTAQIRLTACATTVRSEAAQASCAASVGRLDAFEMTINQVRESTSVTGVFIVDSSGANLTGTVDTAGVFQFSTTGTTDRRGVDEGLTAIERVGTFVASGDTMTGRYETITTQSQLPAGLADLNGQTMHTWQVISLERI